MRRYSGRHLEPLAFLAFFSPDMQRLDRLTRRRDRLAAGVASRKTRISALLLGLFPGLWECFEDLWNPRARWIYRHRLNPFRLTRTSQEHLNIIFARVTPLSSSAIIQRESTALWATARRLVAVYKPAHDAALATDLLFRTATGDLYRAGFTGGRGGSDDQAGGRDQRTLSSDSSPRPSSYICQNMDIMRRTPGMSG